MKISFPRLGDYDVAIGRLLRIIFPDDEVIMPPPFTRQTIELGAKYSPDFVCMPFKYNLGNFIEAAKDGANILFQGSGGCRYSYYTELQNQILHELGCDVQLVNLFCKDFSIVDIFRRVRELGCKMPLPRFAYHTALCLKSIALMDKIDFFVRENIGFECKIGSFEAARKRFLGELGDVKSFTELRKIKQRYTKEFSSIAVRRDKNIMRIGLVGELYSLMEPFSNFFIEKELAKNNIMIKRFTNATYLLFGKNKFERSIPKASGGVLKYKIGADGAESVTHMLQLAKEGYDGIIHLKPFGCTPEVNAMPILIKKARELDFPIIYLTFDSQSSETGIKTRLEAFYDMLEIKRQSREGLKVLSKQN